MSDEKPSGSDGDGGCCGCVSAIFVIIALWALIFGVTVSGKHYGISGCDMKNGVKIDR